MTKNRKSTFLCGPFSDALTLDFKSGMFKITRGSEFN